METKHTKGKWTVYKPGHIGCTNVAFGEITGFHAFVEIWHHLFKSKEESEANAKLIAAAPDLLNALISAMRIVDLWTLGGKVAEEHMDEAIALNSMRESFESAIEKATK